MGEVAFFKESSQQWGLDMECWKERKATKDYTAEMARVASLGSLEDGLVFLWVMEKVSIITDILFFFAITSCIGHLPGNII